VRKFLCYSAFAAAALFGSPAGAVTTIVFSPYQVALNPSETLVTDFDGPTAAGFVLSGTGSILTGSIAGFAAAPATSAVTQDTTAYLAVEPGQTETLSTPAISEISFYVGSVDAYNFISFTQLGGGTLTFSGLDLTNATAAFDLANGNQIASTSNGRYTFNFSTAVTGVTLTSTQPAFEISNIGAIAAVVPEPTSWALMMAGFGGLGVVLRRRQAVPATA
jgi:hypothetical protein